MICRSNLLWSRLAFIRDLPHGGQQDQGAAVCPEGNSICRGAAYPGSSIPGGLAYSKRALQNIYMKAMYSITLLWCSPWACCFPGHAAPPGHAVSLWECCFPGHAAPPGHAVSPWAFCFLGHAASSRQWTCSVPLCMLLPLDMLCPLRMLLPRTWCSPLSMLYSPENPAPPSMLLPRACCSLWAWNYPLGMLLSYACCSPVGMLVRPLALFRHTGIFPEGCVSTSGC
jgi:hypothetical protein